MIEQQLRGQLDTAILALEIAQKLLEMKDIKIKDLELKLSKQNEQSTTKSNKNR